MKTIQFTEDYTVEADNGPEYKRGQVVELSNASADHFVNKGIAEVKAKHQNSIISAPQTTAASEIKKNEVAQSSASQPARASRKKTAKKSEGTGKS